MLLGLPLVKERLWRLVRGLYLKKAACNTRIQVSALMRMANPLAPVASPSTHRQFTQLSRFSLGRSQSRYINLHKFSLVLIYYTPTRVIYCHLSTVLTHSTPTRIYLTRLVY